MGTMPMKEDVGQEIYTRDHGVVKVAKNSWQDGRYHIVLCPNGAYQHINGLPISNEAEIYEAFGRNEDGTCPNEEAKQKCLNWFKNRHEQLANPPRPIGFHSDGYPMFADGSVPDFDDLYDYFKPGPILTASIVALQRYNERKGTGAPPKKLRKAAPKPVEEVEVSPAQAQVVAPPTFNPEKYSPRARQEAKTKAKRAAARQARDKAVKAARQARDKAAKAAQPAPPPPQG